MSDRLQVQESERVVTDVVKRWKLYVCGDCGRAAGDGAHLTCDLRSLDRAYNVVYAGVYDVVKAERDRYRKALETIVNDSQRAELADAEYLRGVALGVIDG